MQFLFREDQQFEFKQNTSLQERIKQSEKILSKFQESVPIIVEQNKRSELKQLTEKKFLMKDNLNIYHLSLMIRSKIKLNRATAIYLLINGKDLVKCDTLIKEVYQKYKDPDGFLYVRYQDQKSYGAICCLSISDDNHQQFKEQQQSNIHQQLTYDLQSNDYDIDNINQEPLYQQSLNKCEKPYILQ